MMKSNKGIVFLAFLAILIVFGVLLFVSSSADDVIELDEFSVFASNSVAYNVIEEPQEYFSSGVISLNIINSDLEKDLEE